MKKIYIAAAFALAGCSGFLKEYSQSDIRPGTVGELQEMMMGEAYPSAYTNAAKHFGRYMELLTDDVRQADMSLVAPDDDPAEQNDAERVAANGMGAFTWSPAMFELMDEMGAATDTWALLYDYIKGCNVALDNADKVQGSDAEKANLRGQALALRAFYYWYLVNCFGQPVNAADASALGVPLILQSSVTDIKPRRNTVGEVYAQVEKDLLEAEPLLKEYGQTVSKYRVTYEFACMMLSRIYLYQERWAYAALWAGKIIDRRPALLDMNEPSTPVSCPESPEAIWLYSDNYEWTAQQFFNANGVWLPSDELLGSFEAGDMRPALWFEPTGNSFIMKSPTDYVNAGGKGMRTAEAYLNRAEALINQGGDMTQPLADLNFLRRHRFAADDFVPLSASADLLKICREERRRELCWEEHRWFDLRRWGMHELHHYFQRRIAGTPSVITLPTSDPRWTLPIPQDAIDRNPAL